jgi:hypothetical protein
MTEQRATPEGITAQSAGEPPDFEWSGDERNGPTQVWGRLAPDITDVQVRDAADIVGCQVGAKAHDGGCPFDFCVRQYVELIRTASIARPTAREERRALEALDRALSAVRRGLDEPALAQVRAGWRNDANADDVARELEGYARLVDLLDQQRQLVRTLATFVQGGVGGRPATPWGPKLVSVRSAAVLIEDFAPSVSAKKSSAEREERLASWLYELATGQRDEDFGYARRIVRRGVV